jgi:hypothetical protein
MKLSDTTIITVYYPIKRSKYDIGKYRAWIQNFCKIPSAMVIFTTEEFAFEIYQWRKEYLEITQVCVRPFDSFAMTCPAMMTFWQNQLALDSEKSIHNSDLYAVWAIKQECVRIVINSNKFQSKWFVWCDIGIQRYSDLQNYYTSFPSDVERLCVPGRMTFLEVDKIPDSYILNWVEDKPMEYPIPKVTLGGGCIVGDADAWREFGEVYKEMLKEFALRGWFAGKDSDIYFTMLMEKRISPYRLFFARPFGNTEIPGIEWMSFPVMLGGNMDAELDTRFEPLEEKS